MKSSKRSYAAPMLRVFSVTWLAVGAACLPMEAAFAGASTPQSQSLPGTTVDLRNASDDTLRTHILDTCVIQQWGVSTSNTDEYAGRCGCFARRVVQVLDKDELNAFRQSGVFNTTARTKAQAAQADCKLR